MAERPSPSFSGTPSTGGELTPRTLQYAFLVLIGAALVGAILLHPLIGEERTAALVVTAVVLTGGLFLVRHGYLTIASALLLGTFLGVTTYYTVNGGGVRDIAFLLYPVVVMTAALMVRGRTFVAIALLTLTIATAIPFAETMGWMVALKDPVISWVEVIAVVLIIGIGSLTAYILSHDLHLSLERLSDQREDLLLHQRELIARTDELSESETRWRTLVENIPGAILSLQPGGVVDRVDGMHRTSFDGAGRPLSALFDPAAGTEVEEAFQRCIVRRAPSGCRVPRKEADETRWHEIRFSPVVRHDAVQSVIAIVTDITDRIRAEQSVKELNVQLEARVTDRTRALTAANQELEAFSYSVSHDLRAPLRHVLGYLAMLRQEAGEHLGESPRRYIETIERSARRMATLIDELLDLSRVSRTELRRQSVDLVAMVRGIIEELEPETRGRVVEWTIDELPSVTADPALLRQVIVNLLGNAVKFTRRREVARISIRSTAADGGVTIAVEDNGAGFDMQFAPKLFGLFHRLHTGEEFEGTGIGLAIVRRILERHGGQVTGRGEPDRGATFVLTLPSGPA